MIHIFFVPGMFGSTIEYVLSDFTNELTPTYASIKSDGSMHTFKKQNHPGSKFMLDNMALREINTPLYPFKDMHLPEILANYGSQQTDPHILLYAKNFKDAEQNILFQYHKIAVLPTSGINIFYGTAENAAHDVKKWNSNYLGYNDLKPWEFREWFSIFYTTWIEEWQTSVHQVPDTWFKIPCSDVLEKTAQTFKNIIKFCNLTVKGDLDEFANRWSKAQQYILDEYQLINTIVDATVSLQDFTWRTLNPVAEAMIQKKLRDNGLEIRCNGLDIFPTNSLELYKLLESNVQLHTQGNI